MTILDGSSFSVAPPTPALEKRVKCTYVLFSLTSRENNIHSCPSTIIKIKCNKVQVFNCLADCKQKYRLSSVGSNGTGCTRSGSSSHHGWNTSTAKLFPFLPLQRFEFSHQCRVTARRGRAVRANSLAKAALFPNKSLFTSEFRPNVSHT